jgi:hypothetical protein
MIVQKIHNNNNLNTEKTILYYRYVGDVFKRQS